MLAQPLRRPSSLYDYHHDHHQYQTSSEHLSSRQSAHDWPSSSSTAITQTSAHPQYSQASGNPNYLQAASADQSTFIDHDAPHNFNNLHIHIDSSFESSQEPELMHSDHTAAPVSWNFMTGQLTPTSARTHYRESSLSSIGSAGPASPYNGSTPHPHVILPSDSDIQYDGLPILDQTAYHTFSKPLTPSHTPSQDAFLVPPFPQSYNAQPYNANAHIAALLAMQRQHQAPGGDDESVSAPDYAHSSRQSVANSHESPVTPTVAGEYEDQTRKNDFRGVGVMPKLGRTMSDAYNDELYSPSFTFTSAPSTKVEVMNVPNHSSAVFSQMLQAANDQHLSAPLRSPMNDQSRDPQIAFREGSPLAPVSNGFGSPQRRFSSTQQMREMQKAERDDRIVQQQMQRVSPVQTAMKTISPRDALLDFHETAEDSAMPLFPTQRSPQYQLPTGGVHAPAQSDLEDASSQQSYGSMATTRRPSSSAYSSSSQVTQQPRSNFTFVPPSVPSGVRIPQQYPFVSQRKSQTGNISSLPDRSPEFPSLTSMDSSNSNGGNGAESTDLKKPTGSNADGGTYTCTYHGCTLRFETPAKLQKHKREGHRQAAPLAGGIPASTQAGPHRCFRVNPSTNKVCNTVFSRPYDLTRHEDTIHNASKIKVRCHLCKEEKTFSRNDALTRHMKLVHPHEVIMMPTKRKGDGGR